MSSEANREYRNYYRYYDTPDGCDIHKKILVTSRYGAITGLILSTYDVLMYSHAKKLGHVLRRYAFHTVPLTLIGATFAGVANGVQHLRQEDDVFNYFIGGVACGPFLAYYMGSYHAMFLGGLGLGIIGMIKKTAIDNNFDLIPEITHHMGTVRSWRNDYTLTTDPRDIVTMTIIRGVIEKVPIAKVAIHYVFSFASHMWYRKEAVSALSCQLKY